MFGPNPEKKYPLKGLPYSLETIKATIFLKHFIKRNNIQIGDYTYYNSLENPENFEQENILYHYPFSKEKLIIGKFVAIATNTKFIMASANHKIDGFSTFPFAVMGNGWEKEMDVSCFPNKGDTVVGNDIWFGYDSTILPAVKIGDGAVIAAKSVVTRDVPPYSIVGGNPAKIIRMRFDEKIIADLLKIKWWDWPKEKITKNIKSIIGTDIEKLKIQK
jgi:virginiamycin A acetyltransferase